MTISIYWHTWINLYSVYVYESFHMKCKPLLSPQSCNYSLSWDFTFTELKIALYCRFLKCEMCIWKADNKSLSQFFKNKWFISYYVLDPDVFMIYLRVIENLAGNIKINEWKSYINQPIKTIKIRAYGWIFLFPVCIFINIRRAIG